MKKSGPKEQPLRDRAGLQLEEEQCQQEARRITRKTGFGNQTARILVQEGSQPSCGEGRNEDQHADELTVSKEQLLNKIENSTCWSLCNKQRWLSQRLEAQQFAAHRVPRQDHRILCLDAEADPW